MWALLTTSFRTRCARCVKKLRLGEDPLNGAEVGFLAFSQSFLFPQVRQRRDDRHKVGDTVLPHDFGAV